jgi:hypothetical protein
MKPATNAAMRNVVNSVFHHYEHTERLFARIRQFARETWKRGNFAKGIAVKRIADKRFTGVSRRSIISLRLADGGCARLLSPPFIAY